MTPLTSGLHEECGVFGVFAKEKTNVAATTYYGLSHYSTEDRKAAASL